MLKNRLNLNKKDIFLHVPFSCEFVEQIIYELQCGNDKLLKFVTEKDFEEAREVKVSETHPAKPLEKKDNTYQFNTTDKNLYIFKVDTQRLVLLWFSGELLVSFASANGEFDCSYVDFLAQKNDWLA